MENECSATVAVSYYTQEGQISFDIDTSDCLDSDGSFEYEYEYEEGDGSRIRSSRTVTWPRSHGASQTTVEEDLGLHRTQGLIDVRVTSSSCNCYLTQQEKSKAKKVGKKSAYVFTRVFPPPLESYPDPSSLPVALVREEVGQASWSEYLEFDISTRVIQTKHVSNNYVATRAVRWVVVLGPAHYALDSTTTIVQRTGYEQKQTDTFEQSLNIELSGKYGVTPLTGLSASVKAGLKITSTTSQEWHTETTVTNTRTYKAGNTYITWNLMDTVFVTKTSNVSYSYGAPEVRTIYRVDAPVNTNHQFDCALKYFEDKASDAAAKIARHSIPKRILERLGRHPSAYIGPVDLGFPAPRKRK